jgi:hypothetical protein
VERCSGASVSCPDDAKFDASVVCRARVEGFACDAVKYCDGVTSACPADAMEAQGVLCRAASSTDSCDVAEHCTGTSFQCPVDAKHVRGFSCNDGNDCTVSDQCTSDGRFRGVKILNNNFISVFFLNFFSSFFKVIYL